MLYVTRDPSKHDKGGDKIVIAEGLITIQVVRVEGKQVRIAIDCPRDIDIVRGEFLQGGNDEG